MAHALNGVRALGATPRLAIFFIAVLIVLRFIVGALLPLSADEAYYWLWSRHLAAGYFDHPPAIAFLIRFGTAIFGGTSFGVRFAAIALSALASGLVWRTGAILLQSEEAGALACLLFNLTAMTAVETMAATPDAPAVFTVAAFLFALAKVDETDDGRWWLAAGAAAGLGLLSKYTAFFLGVGALTWLAFTPQRRHWLASPWPYLGAVVALSIFAPNLWWNATHGWMTFVFQFGRIEPSGFTLRFFAEFLGAQIVLATPFIFILGVMGLTLAMRDTSRTTLLAAMILPSILYFAWHSLHDRVQGNWPCFLYPAFAIAAADAMRKTDWKGWAAPIARVSRLAAIALACFMLLAAYAQALFGALPMGRKDPLSRLLAVGFGDVARQVGAARQAIHAGAILTTDYASTSWFAFYQPMPVPVIDVGEDFRWLGAPPASAGLLGGPLLYVVEARWDRHGLLAAHFADVTPIGRIDRSRGGVAITHYVLYRVSGLKGAPVGRAP